MIYVKRIPFNLVGGAFGEPNLPSFFLGPEWFGGPPYGPPPPPGSFPLDDHAGNHDREYFHLQAQIPPLPQGAGWMTMFTSICAVCTPGLDGANPTPPFGRYFSRAYGVDSASPQAIGVPSELLMLDFPYPNPIPTWPQNMPGPWALIDLSASHGLNLGGPVPYPAAPGIYFDPTVWEEMWLTECLGFQDGLAGVTWRTAYHTSLFPTGLPNQYEGPSFDWLEPGWRIPVQGGGGGYFIPPFPTVVDYWLALQTGVFTGESELVAGVEVFPSGQPANPPILGGATSFFYPAVWTFPLLELVIVACIPGIVDAGSGWEGIRRRGRLVGCADIAKLY